jgi:4-hydroxy-4-methyl-2-oxoglutarate aldolase
MSLIVRKIERPDPRTVAGLARAGVATVHEAAGRIGLLDPAIRPIQEGASVAGPAVTVSCAAGDNLMVHAAVEVIEPGDVVVVSVTSPSTDGMLGELLATSLMAHGCRAVIVDSGVRDVAELRRVGFPVWSRAIHAQGTVKATPGLVNLPVTCAGVVVHPGDVVVADDDGVMILARDRAEEVLVVAEGRIAKEEDKRARLAAGELGLDIDHLREKLEGMGVRWVDSPTGEPPA